jgi:broad specificity phosphatase PhoE
MGKVYLLRHGATRNNVQNITQSRADDIALLPSQDTEFTVQSLAKQLSTQSINILCSPMLRAKQTVAPLISVLSAQSANVQMSILNELSEVNFGDFGGQKEGFAIEGKTMQDYRDATQMWYANDQYFQYPNGESITDIVTRCRTILTTLAYYSDMIGMSDHDIVVVGHNRLFRHLLVELGT